jgi:hypothetical protein
VPDGDPLAVGHAGQVPGDGVVQAKRAFLYQLEDDGAGPGLGVAPDTDVIVEGHRLGAAAGAGAEGAAPIAAGGPDHDHRRGEQQVVEERLEFRLQVGGVRRGW